MSVYDSWTEAELKSEWVGKFTFEVSGSGSYSGRDQFRVVCKACGECLHESTTYPNAYIERHEDECLSVELPSNPR